MHTDRMENMEDLFADLSKLRLSKHDREEIADMLRAAFVTGLQEGLTLPQLPDGGYILRDVDNALLERVISLCKAACGL